MVKDEAPRVVFFDGTWRESLSLIEAARDWLNDAEAAAALDRRARAQLLVSCESMRLTARLAHIMAWLFVQRAVAAGELPPGAAMRPENRLGDPEVCGVSGPRRETEALLPARLRELLDSSLRLYERIARLDAMMDLCEGPGAPGLSPSGPGPGTAS
ncbi:MAG: DUF1465 family protein [Rhodospirillaceae bacterium]|nr:DUF1465 family protein [Rhodospirillaceae bacterium]